MKDVNHSQTRFESALIHASRLHQNQRRKGSPTPYIAHLLAVTALVIEDGGDEDEIIAALLHDAPEDQGGLETLEEIRQQFGRRVADIVDGCTDTYEYPKPPWRERKENYINHLHSAPPEVLRVSLADKLHNSRSILRDLQWMGEETWARFTGGREGTLWYYRTILGVYQEHCHSAMVKEFAEVVKNIYLTAGENL